MSSAGHIFDMICRIQANRAYQTDKKQKNKEKDRSYNLSNYTPEGDRINYQESKLLSAINATILLFLIIILVYIIGSNLLA